MWHQGDDTYYIMFEKVRLLSGNDWNGCLCTSGLHRQSEINRPAITRSISNCPVLHRWTPDENEDKNEKGKEGECLLCNLHLEQKFEGKRRALHVQVAMRCRRRAG